MKKSIKFMSAAMALAMCCSAMPMSAFAAETQEAIAGGENKVTVSLDVESTYSVKIPKSVTLDGESKTGSYEVLVNGNIAGNEEIKVIPDSEFTMSQENKDDITAYISQEKQVVSSAEAAAGQTLNGTISADATAGLWNGSFNFAISMGEKEKLVATIPLPSGGNLSAKFNEGDTWQDVIDNQEVNMFQNENGSVVIASYALMANGEQVKTTDTVVAGENYYSFVEKG